MSKNIDVYANGTQLLEAVQAGVLMNTQANGTLNTMTISWGAVGIHWGKPTFTAYVRDTRYTRELLETNPFFTVSMPVGEIDKAIIKTAGTVSGRDEDKIAALGLTPFPAQENGVPGFAELPLTLECKVVYKQRFDADAMSEADLERVYPADPETGERNMHTAYYGEIVAAYIHE